jgi:hypothetical protein
VDPANGGGKIDMKRKWNWPIWIGFVDAVGARLEQLLKALDEPGRAHTKHIVRAWGR